MAEQELKQLLEWRKKQYLQLMEIDEQTRELAGALDRGDRVAVQMVLSMREEPVRRMAEMEGKLEEYLLTLPEEEAVRCKELLKGDAAGRPEEEALVRQIARNQRLLKKIVELDRRVSLRLGGRHSFYEMYRE